MVERGRNLPRTRDDFEEISEAAVSGFRVFIAGKEVTDDVLSLRIQLHDGGNSSMAQVSLNNELDKYVITPDEMAELAEVDLSGIAIEELGSRARTLSELSLEQSFEYDPQNLFPGLFITSQYGFRKSPVGRNKGDTEFHRGLDFGAPRQGDTNRPARDITGEPIISPFDGEVVATGNQFNEETGRGAGNFVTIKTPDNHLVRVFHLDTASPLQPGDKVKAGETNLGPVGSSGGSTGPHIHIEMREIAGTNPDGSPKRGKSIDPRQWRPPGGVIPNKTIAPNDEVQIEGYKRTGSDQVLEVDSVSELVEKDLPRLSSQRASGRFEEIFEGEIYDVKRELMLDKFFRGRFVKNQNYIFIEDFDDQDTETEASSRNSSQGPFPKLNGWVPEYQIYAGSTCFHSKDTVRIFIQDPYDPYVWYYGFSGYLTDDSDVIDVNGNKTVEFTFEDVTRPFKYSRFAFNPQIISPEALTLVTDTLIYSGFKEPFNKLTIPESLFFQVFGGELTGISNEDLGIDARQPTGAGSEVEGPKSKKINYINGVGEFDLVNSRIFILGKEENAAFSPNWNNKKEEGERKFYKAIEKYVVRNFDLPQYHAAVDHRVRYEDLNIDRGWKNEPRIDARADRLAFYQEVINQVENDRQTGILNSSIKDSPIWKTMTFIGENEDLYPVSGRLIMIFPGSLSPTTNTKVLVEDIGSFSATETNFNTRFSIMKLYADRLDFSFYASPRGDLLFEMPFYDFHPDDFGVDETIPAGANRGIYTEARGIVDSLRFAGGWPEYIGPSATTVFSGAGSKTDSQENGTPSYAHAFTIGKNHHIGTYSRSFSDAAIRTLVTTGYYTFQSNSAGGESRQLIGRNIPAIAQALVPSFGVRHEIVNPQGYISSPEGAKLYAEIQLNKMNSAAMQIRADIDAKFDLFLNRPIRIQKREILGTLRSITHEINIGSRSIGTTSMQLDNTRIWTGGVEVEIKGSKEISPKSVGGEKRKVYEPIGTNASRALDYRTLFKYDGDKEKSGQKKKPTARKGLTRTE